MYCKNCGKMIDEKTDYCPHCGVAQKDESSQSIPPRAIGEKSSDNTLAVLGFVISLISLILNFFGLVGIAAVIISVLGLIKVETYNGKGKSMAIIGIAIGVFSIFYGLLTIM